MPALSKVMSEEELQIVFGNIEDIAAFSYELLKALTKVVAQPVKEQMVGELLMSKVNVKFNVIDCSYKTNFIVLCPCRCNNSMYIQTTASTSPMLTSCY